MKYNYALHISCIEFVEYQNRQYLHCMDVTTRLTSENCLTLGLA